MSRVSSRAATGAIKSISGKTHIGVNGFLVDFPQFRNAHEHILIQRLVQDGAHHLLLTAVAVEVGGIPTRADVPQRIFSIQMMQTRFHINVRLSGRDLGIGIRVVERALDHDVHAAHRIDDTAIAAEVHHRVVVYGNTKVVLDGRLEQRGAAAGIAGRLGPQIGRVDLVQSPRGNPGVIIARNGDQAHGRDIGEDRSDHHHVGARDTAGCARIGSQQQEIDRPLRLLDKRHR